LILDVGCGQPTFLEACAKKYNCRSLGIDFSDHGWKTEKERFQSLQLEVGEVKDLDKNLHPDVITMWHYLEHDYDPVANLSALRALSKNDTKLVIEVPNFDSVSRKKYGDKWAGYHTPRHTFLFSPSNIRLLLKNTGWEVLETDIKGTLDPYNLFWMSEMEQNGIDWTKNMETEFWGYVRGMVGFQVKNAFSAQKSLGIMTISAKAV
jgi:2-polyprenyl-3-methyl-5-hydroxy-6-metoxy-1,4-benzoquinol methylase